MHDLVCFTSCLAVYMYEVPKIEHRYYNSQLQVTENYSEFVNLTVGHILCKFHRFRDIYLFLKLVILTVNTLIPLRLRLAQPITDKIIVIFFISTAEHSQ